MKLIGITGGVGAGKSKILKSLGEHEDILILRADRLAKELMEPGKECYQKIIEAFEGEDITDEAGAFDPQKLSEKIFSDENNRKKLNEIVHPIVKKEILFRVDVARGSGRYRFYFVEAALLIEDGYKDICDELWYVYASEEVRRTRLKETRGYSDEKIDNIFKSQLSESDFRYACDRLIDNDGSLAETRKQVRRFLAAAMQGENRMISLDDNDKDYCFGLDIGTRNVVGTVGYKDGDRFHVTAQYSIEHESRAMLDGQIHDIGRVASTIAVVKEELEAQVGFELTEVCIAAAGRVLKTVTTRVEHCYDQETVVTGEDLNTLDLMGIDQAQRDLLAKGERYKFYCVGYTVMKYYLNGERFSNIEGHKAERIEEVIIVTFLPEDVVDGLYSAVERCGLKVANLTLEPIAAINVAIPENFRMLNIALVDVGAGTSDICITKDGTIIAYGMIPYAGDELTEVLVQAYLVDFATAEMIKKASTEQSEITYEDIMGIKHTIKAKDVWKLTDPIMEKITTDVAQKIKDLNGDKSVAAAFIVGGGGKIHGFCEALAKKLDIAEERVALRGKEVMKEIDFEQKDIKKDPLLVTPIGICLNYYETKNSFTMVHVNDNIVKLYDNGRLKVVDAALAAGYDMEELFPQRGKEINFTVDGVQRMVRGTEGESAIVMMNGTAVGLNDKLEPNSTLQITKSTVGERAELRIEQLEEYSNSNVVFVVNGMRVSCPKFVEVNGSMVEGTHVIEDGDVIEMVNYYTVGQLAEFMDVEIDMNHEIIVNNRSSDLDTLIYENFTIEWTTGGYSINSSYDLPDSEYEETEEDADYEADTYSSDDTEAGSYGISTDGDAGIETDGDVLESEAESVPTPEITLEDAERDPSMVGKIPEGMTIQKDGKEELVSKYMGVGYGGDHVPGKNTFATKPTRPNTPFTKEAENAIKPAKTRITVMVNGDKVELSGQRTYIFVDVFNKIDFDPNSGDGRAVATSINGVPCGYSDVLKDGDEVEIYWKD